MHDNYMTPSEVSDYLGVPYGTVVRPHWAKRNGLRRVKAGHNVYYYVDEVHDLRREPTAEEQLAVIEAEFASVQQQNAERHARVLELEAEVSRLKQQLANAKQIAELHERIDRLAGQYTHLAEVVGGFNIDEIYERLKAVGA